MTRQNGRAVDAGIEIKARKGKIRLWFPKAHPYGGKTGSAAVVLSHDEAEELASTLLTVLGRDGLRREES